MAHGLGFSMVMITSATTASVDEFWTPEACRRHGFISTSLDVRQMLGLINYGVILSTFSEYLGNFSSLITMPLSTATTFALFGIGRADSESEGVQAFNEKKVLS